MLSYTGGLVLFAALLHASWNAMLHGNRDRFLSMTWMSIAIAAVATLVILFTPRIGAGHSVASAPISFHAVARRR